MLLIYPDNTASVPKVEPLESRVHVESLKASGHEQSSAVNHDEESCFRDSGDSSAKKRNFICTLNQFSGSN